MRRSLILSVPMALAWMPLTANVSLESFGVGFVLSFAILTLLFYGEPDASVTWRRLPDQAAAAVLYLLVLFRDIYLSSVDVAKRVVNPDMPLNPGIIAVSTQLESADETTAGTIAAVSAHGITITPGELVVDFDGTRVMYVHCLDVTASTQVAASNQAKRMALLRRIVR
ncbi:MAG: Na+/H+ antiporter subunit E [Anaerolineae bacterium]|nr:Na+/H+ antiporter subunit E [Anaerolineae bacterium]